MLVGYHGQFDPLLQSSLRATLPDVMLAAYRDLAASGAAGEMRALVTRSGLVLDEAFFASAPRLRLVVKAGSGTDNIDHDAALRRQVEVIATGGSERSVAELAIALTLACLRHLPVHHGAMRHGRWDSKGENIGGTCGGRRLGVVGFGRIGRETARLAHALGMSISVYDRGLSDPGKAAALAGLEGRAVADLRDLMEQCDVVSLHMPWVPGQASILGPGEIAAMPAHAVLINTARAQLVDRQALFDALSEGRIAGAGLDVHYDEGGNGDVDLIALPNVVALPHVGAQTHETHREIARRAAECIVAHFKVEGELT